MTIIKKGDFVEVELITSEAIHEAVVKCFVVAGFKDCPNMGDFKNMCFIHLGLGVGNSGRIHLFSSYRGGKNPLTLQQLFTAENGLQWPSFATEIRTDDNAVWFFGGGQAEHICGSIQPIPYRVLATRQPKEKEVNEALDKAVIELGGKYPSAIPKDVSSQHCMLYVNSMGTYIPADDVCAHKLVCTREQFEQRAKELGFINGYRWGVEYPTNGKRPELADGVLVCFKEIEGDWDLNGEREVWKWNWVGASGFKITDPIFKPADTSYLNASTKDQSLTHSEEGLTHKDGDLSDLSIAIANAMNAAVAVGEVETAKWLQEINKDVLQLNATRKAELERKKLIDEAAAIISGGESINGNHIKSAEGLLFAGWRPTK